SLSFSARCDADIDASALRAPGGMVCMISSSRIGRPLTHARTLRLFTRGAIMLTCLVLDGKIALGCSVGATDEGEAFDVDSAGSLGGRMGPGAGNSDAGMNDGGATFGTPGSPCCDRATRGVSSSAKSVDNGSRSTPSAAVRVSAQPASHNACTPKSPTVNTRHPWPITPPGFP